MMLSQNMSFLFYTPPVALIEPPQPAPGDVYVIGAEAGGIIGGEEDDVELGAEE